MTPDTKKLICDLAGVEYETEILKGAHKEGIIKDKRIIRTEITLNILVRAMWAINRDIEKGYFVTFVNGGQVAVYRNKCGMDFMKKLFSFESNNETQALSSAVEYVVKEMER
jgi:hypothetical protein